MKRIPSGLAAVVAVVALGALASACNVTPDAASVNGDTISVATLNTQLTDIDTSAAAGCLYELKNAGTLGASVDGLGGSGTKPTGLASGILSGDVANLVAAQYAASAGLHLTVAQVSAARTQYVASLDGAISAAVQQAQSLGGATRCQKADGSAYTGAALLAALPATLRDNEIADQAVFEALLVRGADVSDAAVLKYYLANPTEFTQDCVSAITVSSQADADAVVAKLRAGASFASLAASTSMDTASAAKGGQLGCTFPESQVLQSLQLTAVTLGKPVTPIQVGATTWEVYEVTSRTPVAVADAAPTIREELLHLTANTSRVSKELLAFARRSSVTVNPQYGTWMGLRIAPPVSPPARYLLPASPGSAVSPATSAPTSSSATTGG